MGEENTNFAFGRSNMNKVWQKPKLIILYRGRPEERVLATCKDGIGTDKPSQHNLNNACLRPQCTGVCASVFWT